MRCEAEVRARLQADEAELCRLSEEITYLTWQVTRGGPNWRADLEMLADRMRQRRTLQAHLDSFRWVLASEAQRLAG
ncbi:MAG TPA: hypothetical protein VHB98_16865 [Chloroflexota bacterium]|nr:hypothetical protein [Chloroflexota bacterium]